MDFVQGAVPIVHPLTDDTPPVETGSFVAVVPMTGRELERESAVGVLEAMRACEPERIVVPIRADPDMASRMANWLWQLDSSIDVFWCNAPSIQRRLDGAGITHRGKGSDMWLAVGHAATLAECVCCFDADVVEPTTRQIRRLVAPVDGNTGFAKAYYPRVEDGRLYGRLCRLLVRPLLLELANQYDHPLLAYLREFRYPLAGEFAVRSDVVTDWSFPPDMGLEMGTLGEAYRTVGATGSVQVGFDNHQHHHRSVDGDTGLVEMAPAVTGAVERILSDVGIQLERTAVRRGYLSTAEQLLEAYARDARLNGLTFDFDHERYQISQYATAVENPRTNTWLPAWSEIAIDPSRLYAESTDALSAKLES